MGNDIHIGTESQVVIEWVDNFENYTSANEEKIKSYFHNKYGIPKSIIRLDEKPRKRNSVESIDVGDSIIENILDNNYQRSLFKRWIEKNEIDVNLQRIFKLDEKVNDQLGNDLKNDVRFRKWNIKSVDFPHFLSFGEDSHFDYQKYEGLVAVHSNPANQGGKTVFAVDLPMYIFFNVTTKATKDIDIINRYSGANTMPLKSVVTIDGQDYVIERNITKKKNRKGVYAASRSVDFYSIDENGNKVENLNGKDPKETDKNIANKIGSKEDFLLTIISTGSNLEDLISMGNAKKSDLFNRFVGLDLIEKKEDIVKSMHKKWLTTSIFKNHDADDIIKDNLQLEDDVRNLKQDISVYNSDIENLDIKILQEENKKDELITSKHKIDNNLITLNESNLQSEIDGITVKGKKLSTLIKGWSKSLEDIGDVDYSENDHAEQRNLLLNHNSKESEYNTEIRTKNRTLKTLEEGSVCPTCNRALEEVDHTDQIQLLKISIGDLMNKRDDVKEKLTSIRKRISELDELSKLVNEKYKLSLKITKAEVEIEKFRDDVREKLDLMKRFKESKVLIEENKEIDSKILENKYALSRLRSEKMTKVQGIERFNASIEHKKREFERNVELCKKIEKESEVDKIFTIYTKMVGRNGISGMVVSTIIPIINKEIKRLIEDVCDFNFFLGINDKNEILYDMNKDGVLQPIKSGSGFERTVASLALKCVLTRLSVLPKPDIIVFDEILGKVSNENLDKIRLLFERIKEQFRTIFVISHNERVSDWADKIIFINKNQNISTVGN